LPDGDCCAAAGTERDRYVIHWNPFDLTLSDHREDLIAANDLSRRAHRLEAEARANQSFDPSMVLLDNIIIWHV
jgi:hypothetical protein